MQDGIVLRFVTGGHRIISDISFSERPGPVKLTCCLMVVLGRHMFFRDPRNWGWIAISNEGTLVSFDRCSGWGRYEGPIKRFPNGQPRTFIYLETPLKDIPLFGNYAP